MPKNNPWMLILIPAILFVTSCKQVEGIDCDLWPVDCKPVDSSCIEKWTSSEIVGVWRGSPADVLGRVSSCEFVFLPDGTGYVSEAFSFSSVSAEKRLAHKIFWAVNDGGDFTGILITRLREANKSNINCERLILEKVNGETTALLFQRGGEDGASAKLCKVSDNLYGHPPKEEISITIKPDKTLEHQARHKATSTQMLVSPVGGGTCPSVPEQLVGTWTGVTTTWPTNHIFKIVVNRNGTGSLEEGFSKIACDTHEILKHLLLLTIDEDGQSRGLSVAVVNKRVFVYDFWFEKRGNEYLFNLQYGNSDIVDIAKIRKVSPK